MLTIEPCYEPDGEGNGWATAYDDADATTFMVFDGDTLIEAFATREEARQFVASVQGGKWHEDQ